MNQYHSYALASSEPTSENTPLSTWARPVRQHHLASGKAIEAVKIAYWACKCWPDCINFAYDCIRYVSAVASSGFCKAGVVDALKDGV